MNHAGVLLLFQAPLNATHLPDAAIQKSRRLNLAALPFQNQAHDLQHVPFTPTHLNQVLLHPHFMSNSGHFYLRNTGHFYLRMTNVHFLID